MLLMASIFAHAQYLHMLIVVGTSAYYDQEHSMLQISEGACKYKANGMRKCIVGSMLE